MPEHFKFFMERKERSIQKNGQRIVRIQNFVYLRLSSSKIEHEPIFGSNPNFP